MNIAFQPNTRAPLPATMNAAIVVGPGRIDITETTIRAPSNGEVLVRLQGCGVCASNLEPWAGPDWMRYPTAPGDLGHEGWGLVEATGPDVEGLAVGDRVAALFYNSYAQYDVGPASHVVPLPRQLDDLPAPMEPLACAVNIFRRSGIGAGDKVAIVGAGFIGLLLLQLAKNADATVTVLSRRATSLEHAIRFDADRLVQTGDDGDPISTATLRDGLFDCVIEATGKQEPLDLAGQLVREGGRLVIAGYHQDGPRWVNMQLWNWRGIDVINAHERDDATRMAAMRKAVALVASGQVDLAGMLTDSFPLHRLADALDATRDRRDGFVKAVVEMA